MSYWHTHLPDISSNRTRVYSHQYSLRCINEGYDTILKNSAVDGVKIIKDDETGITEMADMIYMSIITSGETDTKN